MTIYFGHRHLLFCSVVVAAVWLFPFERVECGNEVVESPSSSSKTKSVDRYIRMRNEMVRTQIEARGVHDEPLLDVMRTVKRHEFAPLVSKSSAYSDGPLPIGHGQTISQPYIVAFMTEYLKLSKTDKVLEIGTGSGYQAAVLAHLVDQVYTIEIIKELAEMSESRFQRLGYKNISVRHADGYHGWPEEAPFDAIIVTAAAELIPPPLIKQLKDGGRMIIPVGPSFYVQNLLFIEKNGGEVKTESVLPVRFVPFTRSE